MHPLYSLVISQSVGLCNSVVAQKDNARHCDCFRTEGVSPAYFTNHRFFDYRNIPSQFVSHPAVTTDIDNDQDGPSSSDFFTSTSWKQDWEVQTWNNADALKDSTSDANVLMGYSRNNVYIESSNETGTAHKTHLTLRTTRTPDFQSAGEIDSVATDYRYLSARFYARVVGSRGACAGMFTWYCPGLCRSPSALEVEEADIEILTKDPDNYIHFTNQPSESQEGLTYKNATANVSMPVSWNDWNEYRYDWLPGLSAWYVNGESVANISFHAPDRPAQILINMWSNGGSWTGNMSIGDVTYLQIQWIQIAYNTSDNKPPQKRHVESTSPQVRDVDSSAEISRRTDSPATCKKVCRIDSKNSVGVPIRSTGGVNRPSAFAVLVPFLVYALC